MRLAVARRTVTAREWIAFSFCSAGLSWESEVWIAEDPEHLIHFDGERFLGPYPDVMPPK